MTLFKPRVDKVIFALITRGLCVIIPSLKKVGVEFFWNRLKKQKQQRWHHIPEVEISHVLGFIKREEWIGIGEEEEEEDNGFVTNTIIIESSSLC